MSQQVFSVTAGVIFLVIALAHLLRVVVSGTFVVLGLSVPMWASGVAVVITGFLGYQGFRLAGKGSAGI